MRFNHWPSLFFSSVVLILFLLMGFSLSQRKLLWNDELFTQQTAIDMASYGDLLTLRFPDGNKNPLFYLIQKATCNFFAFHLPQEESAIRSRVRDISAQVIMRIPSNVYMSLALAIIFYFFTRYFSIWTAIYALSVALVTPMVWDYWVEARPYPLWFLLTTVQLLLVYVNIIAPQTKTVKRIFITHLLLAFTTPTSVCQILIATLMLAWKGKYNWKQLCFVWALPTGIALLYYFLHSPSIIRTYFFEENLFDAIMPERIFVYILYGVTAWVLPEKYKKIPSSILFLPITLGILASACLILWVDFFHLTSDQGFFSRYLIYLAPTDILMFTLASYDFRQWSRQNIWISMNVSIFLGGLLVVRGLMTYRGILAAATYLHSPGRL